MKKYLIFDLDGTLLTNVGNVLSIVNDFFEKNSPENREKANHIFSSTQGTPLKKQLEMLFDENDPRILEYTDEIYNMILKHGTHVFYKGIPEKIKELSKNYSLFLTTGNSTQFAYNAFKESGILDCFDKILGSDRILKGEDHLKIFEELSGDKDFYKNSLYIGDGTSDREFAKQAGIDFIHIGNEKADTYEIKSVAEIDTILDTLKEEK